MDKKVLKEIPLKALAAVSCGIYKGKPVLDLDYDEDSEAETDADFVTTADEHYRNSGHS